MAAYYDENDWRSIEEEQLRFFYQEFSSEIRKKLISRTLISPSSVYDVLYPQTKDLLLAKNKEKIIDLEKDSQFIRESLLSKLAEKNISLDKISEDYRESLIFRNKIIKDADDVFSNSHAFRKEQLSKNINNNSDLYLDSELIRNNNIVKNNLDLNKLEDIAEYTRLVLLSKNSNVFQINIDNESNSIRKNLLSKNNNSENIDISKNSEDFRLNNIAKNKKTNPGVEDNSENFRFNNINKNVLKDTDDLENSSEVAREKNIAKNLESNINLDDISNTALKNNINANTKDDSNIDSSSQEFRNNNLSKNDKIKNLDLQLDSEFYKQSNISKNQEQNSDLLNDSTNARLKSLSSNIKKPGDLLKDSESFLRNSLSENNANNINLSENSKIYLDNNLKNNKDANVDLSKIAENFLKENISVNKPSSGDLLNDSVQLRNDLLGNSIQGHGDLLNDSNQLRDDLLGNNVPGHGDLLSDSGGYLHGNLVPNIPGHGDLLSDSNQLRDDLLGNNTQGHGDLLGNNTQGHGDLLSDSNQLRDDLLGNNIPGHGDLLSDSGGYLHNNLVPNVPGHGDLLSDSGGYLHDNLVPNVPGHGDLLSDSDGYLHNNLIPNIPGHGDLLNDSNQLRDDLLGNNTQGHGDLLSDSGGYLHDNLIPNIPGQGDLLNDSNQLRDDLLGNNTQGHGDLLSDSKSFRNNNLSANPPSDELGINIEGLGTSAFIGVSKVLLQGILLRQVLLSKNKTSLFNIDSTADVSRHNLIAKNLFQLNNDEYSLSSSFLIDGINLYGKEMVGFYGRSVIKEIEAQKLLTKNIDKSIHVPLQRVYGNNITIETFPGVANGVVRYGAITEAIRGYNLSRNFYNLHGLQPMDPSFLQDIKNNNDDGFQQMLSNTPGLFKGSHTLFSKSNLVSVGTYTVVSPEDLFKSNNITVGTAGSMMAQTVAGNPLNDIEFQSGRKGVVKIIRTIRNSSAANFTSNYDVQNSKKFVIGTENGMPKVSRQRYTISNPYKPGNAKKVTFYLQNYSSGEGFYFPPYIQDYADSYGANFNATNFLGRPEPVYTYNNSSREGTITFVVLTDYSQNIILGTNYDSDNLEQIKTTIGRHFTDSDVQNNLQKSKSQDSNSAREVKKQEVSNAISEQSSHKSLASSPSESSVVSLDIDSLKKEFNSLEKDIQNSFVNSNKSNVYSETNPVIGNINNFMTSKPSRINGDIDTMAEDSKKRIDEMVKNLAFQPAFFSGDKVDFVTKMDFLAKLTRPATAHEGSGFSFTRPPVCHIRLGDWWRNDIIIESVSFNYSDSTWTLDDGRTQPMWAVVSMNFKFVGPYGGQKGGPVLSDDINGFYAPRGTSSRVLK